jgi:hypothetical protein
MQISRPGISLSVPQFLYLCVSSQLPNQRGWQICTGAKGTTDLRIEFLSVLEATEAYYICDRLEWMDLSEPYDCFFTFPIYLYVAWASCQAITLRDA